MLFSDYTLQYIRSLRSRYMADQKRNTCKGCGKLLFTGQMKAGEIAVKCPRCKTFNEFVGNKNI